MKEIVRIPEIMTSDASYSHVVRAGLFLFLTSQLSADLKWGTILDGDIAAQTRKALENVKFLLNAAGATTEDVVQARVYLRGRITPGSRRLVTAELPESLERRYRAVRRGSRERGQRCVTCSSAISDHPR
jgi:enamine deaminase RidA (YjgF/YER057c/UK114 family)